MSRSWRSLLGLGMVATASCTALTDLSGLSGASSPPDDASSAPQDVASDAGASRCDNRSPNTRFHFCESWDDGTNDLEVLKTGLVRDGIFPAFLSPPNGYAMTVLSAAGGAVVLTRQVPVRDFKRITVRVGVFLIDANATSRLVQINVGNQYELRLMASLTGGAVGQRFSTLQIAERIAQGSDAGSGATAEVGAIAAAQWSRLVVVLDREASRSHATVSYDGQTFGADVTAHREPVGEELPRVLVGIGAQSTPGTMALYLDDFDLEVE